MSRVIAIISGKGGTGKTTTSVNLAAALAHFDEDVLLIDADLQTPSVAVHLGEPEIPVTLTEYLKGTDHLKNALYKTRLGFKLLPSSLSFTEFGKELNRLKTAVRKARKLSEFVVIDCPPGLGKTVQFILQESDEVLVVTNPELPALADGIKSIKLADSYDLTVLGVVMNKVMHEDYECPKSEAEGLLDYPIIASLPGEKTVKLAMNANKSVIQTAPRSKYGRGIKQLAAKLTHRPTSEYKPSFWDRLLRRW